MSNSNISQTLETDIVRLCHHFVANQHVMISHQHVEAISTTKQEAKRKQKALDILASTRRIGFEINHRYCSPILFGDIVRRYCSPILFADIVRRYCSPILFADIVCQTTDIVRRLPPFAPSQKSIYSRPFGSDFSFPSHVLLYFYASNQIHSHSHKR
jgi:hypothetical protein